MAKRIVFTPTSSEMPDLYKEVLIDFEWVPGMAISQARKSVRNLHESAAKVLEVKHILEVSTRSEVILGLSLSAFNLHVNLEGKSVSVESVYQGSKVFAFGGPYLDILNASSLDAKRDSRLKSSGELIGFSFDGVNWPLKIAPNFYDFLFISGLVQHPERHLLNEYQAFTDIAFSQVTLDYKTSRSYNCQARSVAIYISLMNRHPEKLVLSILRDLCLTSDDASEQLGLF